MRTVVWVLDSLRVGGAERLALRFAAQAPPEWRIELVALQAAPGSADLAAMWGGALEPLAGRVHQLGMRSLGDAAGWARWLRFLRARRPALVHAHLRYATIWAGAAARLLGCPLVATLHLGPSPEASRRQRWAAGLERRARRQAARVIYVSEAQRAAWGRQAERERSVVIGNGVMLPAPATAAERARAREEARAARGFGAGECVLTTVAVVRPRKGWRTWLEAVERIAPLRPEARFVWVGGGPDHAALRQAAAASRWAHRICLPGAQSEVGGWLRASDLFLFPSDEEAQPTAVMEAMAAGLGIIASDLPAIAEVLGPAGCRVAPGDAEGLARAALAWTEPDAAAARAAAGVAARERVEARYGESAWQRRLLQLYEEVGNEAGLRRRRRAAAEPETGPVAGLAEGPDSGSSALPHPDYLCRK